MLVCGRRQGAILSTCLEPWSPVHPVCVRRPSVIHGLDLLVGREMCNSVGSFVRRKLEVWSMKGDDQGVGLDVHNAPRQEPEIRVGPARKTHL